MRPIEDIAREAGLAGSDHCDCAWPWLERFAALVRAEALEEADIYRAERDHARACLDRAVRMLSAIHMLCYPAPTTLDDGRTLVFRPENPHEFLQALSDRIRAIPDELDALDTK